DLVTVDDLAFFIADNQPVGIAVKRKAKIGTVLDHAFLQDADGGRAAVFVDVGAVGGNADGNHLGAQFVQDARGDLVGRAVGAIDDDLQPLEPQAFGEGVLDVFDIPAAGVVKTAGTAKIGRRRKL